MKQKLIQLIKDGHEYYYSDQYPGLDVHVAIAEHLMAHGVTISRWIPVVEKLPDLIPIGNFAFSETVSVLTSGRKVISAIWNGLEWVGDFEFWEAEDEEITHWTPVLLPLPEPPKENE